MLENWIGDRYFDGDRDTESVSMKPAVAALMEEAFRIAVCDSIDPDLIDDAGRVALHADLYKVTEEQWASIDPHALCKNITNRMFGTGANTVRGVYSGNASAREAFEACVAKPDLNETDRFESDLRKLLEGGSEGEEHERSDS